MVRVRVCTEKQYFKIDMSKDFLKVTITKNNAKNRKWDCVKLKGFCTTKDTQQLNTQPSK